MHASCRLEVWQGHKVIALPLKDLWQSVPTAEEKKTKFYAKLKEDIRKHGIKMPLIVVESTVGVAWQKKAQYKEHLLTPPGNRNPEISDPPHYKKLNIIWGGSNRYAILKELGYTHADCIVLQNNFQLAYNFQGKQRQPFQDLHRLL